jgi:diadenosine tetraphosphate (Ap4A) HIT family hydrolase
VSTAADCLFCREDGGAVLWRDDQCRVVLADEPDYPGLCRVILARHVREMTDLDTAAHQVPHVHWHVIPRYRDDRHFPAPVWGRPARDAPARPAVDPHRLARLLAVRV